MFSIQWKEYELQLKKHITNIIQNQCSKRRWTKWKLKWATDGGRDPRKSGEAHRWMYDRVSLVQLLEVVGFSQCEVTTFDRSSIPNWEKYNLDVSRHGPFPRKPDSLFVEGIKP